LTKNKTYIFFKAF